MESRIGGHILADQLALQGVDTVFCVPGESFLPLLDGFYAQSNVIRVINTRHEGGAANMAEAYGKLTGKPGICVVTRGPGACNASIGVHTAFQDSTPMILLIGQVGREMMDREAFQEMDYRRVFGEMAKWVAQIDSAERIPEYLSRAFHVAQSGRPGPVVLAMPEDVLAEVAVAMDVKPARPAEAAPTVEAMTELRNLLLRAERPLMMLGGPTWTGQAVADMRAFAEANTLPVAVSFRAQDRFDNRSPNYAGDVGIGVNPKLAARIKESDLLLVVGPRLGEMTTQGYALMDVPQPNQTLIHVHAGAEELGRVYRPDLAINASMGQFAKAAAALEPVGGGQWKAWTEAANSDYRARLAPTVVPGDVNFGEIVSWLNERLPENAILTNGAGNYTAWVHRFYQYKHFKSQLAPTSGAMGYSVPAAIAAKIVEPERMVISFNGDGCFMMLGQELATAVQFDAKVVFIVINNSMLGTIRMHQERNYPDRKIATDLQNPDFVKLAEAYGAAGFRVEKTEDFQAAFEAAVDCGKPAVIEVVTDPQALTPVQTLEAARQQGMAQR